MRSEATSRTGVELTTCLFNELRDGAQSTGCRYVTHYYDEDVSQTFQFALTSPDGFTGPPSARGNLGTYRCVVEVNNLFMRTGIRGLHQLYARTAGIYCHKVHVRC